MLRWSQPFTRVLDLFLESNCPLCQRSPATPFCSNCQQQIQQCQLSTQDWQNPSLLIAWGRYEGALKRAIAALKYHNSPHLARPLGNALAQVWLASPMAAVKSVTVVPIPMHPDKQKQRGFNQAELLAAAFCEQTGLPLERHGLVRIRTTEAQFTLSAAQRAQNLAGAFQVSPRLLSQRSARTGSAKTGFAKTSSAKTVLLLDDIYTTGATARSAIQAFQQQKIRVLGIVAIATTQQN